MPRFSQIKRYFLYASLITLSMASPVHAQPAQGGILNWALPVEPPSLVPINTPAGGVIDVGPKIVEGLLTFNDQLDPKPLLATAWEVAPDGLRYTFKLRKGVKWHDGADFTSADVAWSIQANKQHHSRGRATFAQVREIQTPDPHTIVLLLDKPAPYLLTALAASETPIVARHLYEGKDIASNPHNRAPVGTGPFIFKEWVKGSHLILERNPNYWDQPRPYLDKIVVRFITDPSAVAAALEAGSIDIAGNAIANGDIDRLGKLPHLNVDVRGWPWQGHHNQILFNFDTPALKNRDVRRAIAHVISVDQINKLAWYGKGVPSASAIGVASRYHDSSIAFHEIDPKKAEALLDQAGYPRGADGKRLTLRLLYNPYRPPQIAEIIRQSLQRIGIDASIKSYDFATYTKTVYTDRDFDITVEGLSNVFDPTVGVQRGYWSKNFKIGLPFSNTGNYVNPEIDRLLEAAAVEPDEATRKDLFLQFQKTLWEDVAGIDLGKPPETVVSNVKVKNAVPTAERLYGSFSELYLAP
ncbi:peptide/nickel transport system substrate-binding protein [Lampropedia hyalina DSM 16112]|jgi:peptide/nickel transport system substrate-binding protein|uniref:Peptide/nickel transport system substrate-binding protein n=1 Tax=Lampropedia hyalina DSM 16112 TaxID=1122156 RepID=A0A1M4SN62_9BURK|nr:ABC transporter substrate-binding protein [Lampropedia hyalina]SHE33714.1 peptide/nickel transport system substrate-binding protein [Lampropedia hyalina DSM 16112]